MTPKEKANELIAKFSAVGLQRRSEGVQCALIAIDEIILAIPDAGDDDSPYNHELRYWQQVKQEIEKQQ